MTDPRTTTLLEAARAALRTMRQYLPGLTTYPAQFREQAAEVYRYEEQRRARIAARAAEVYRYEIAVHGCDGDLIELQFRALLQAMDEAGR
jgi:hypothetical protein